MSTKKVLAKIVKVSYLDYPDWRKPYFWFETENKETYCRVDFNPSDYPDIKIYFSRKLNVPRKEKWAYSLYEVPRKDLIGRSNSWKHSKTGIIVYKKNIIVPSNIKTSA